MTLSSIPDSIAEDGELVAEALAQTSRLLGCPSRHLPLFAKNVVFYILDGGKRPVAATSVQKSIVRAAKQAISQLLAEYPYPVPPKVHERLK